MLGELPAEDAERVDRGVEGEDISDRMCKEVSGEIGFEGVLRGIAGHYGVIGNGEED